MKGSRSCCYLANSSSLLMHYSVFVSDWGEKREIFLFHYSDLKYTETFKHMQIWVWMQSKKKKKKFLLSFSSQLKHINSFRRDHISPRWTLQWKGRNLKGIVPPKTQTLLYFTHPQVIQDVGDCFLLLQQNIKECFELNLLVFGDSYNGSKYWQVF